jgi:CheY-like chemotaxis protein
VSRELKILVLDDDPVILEIARIVLKSLGYQVLKREDPLGIESEIVHERPDVVLVDIYMPVISGDQLIRSIKDGGALKGAKEPAFVLYSGAPESEVRQLVEETGADGAIHKTGGALDFASNFAGLLRHLNLN